MATYMTVHADILPSPTFRYSGVQTDGQDGKDSHSIGEERRHDDYVQEMEKKRSKEGGIYEGETRWLFYYRGACDVSCFELVQINNTVMESLRCNSLVLRLCGF